MSRGQESSETLRLRKELVHARTQVADLQEELEEKTNLYIKAISDRDQYREKLTNAKESIQKVEDIVQSKVNLSLEKERKELARLREENDLLKRRIEIFDSEKLSAQQKEKQLQDKINGLTQDLQFYARNQDMRDCMQRMDKLREESDLKEHRISEHLQLVNQLQRQLEDLAAENRTLRKMAAVPDNYGIDLAQIKLHTEKKIENYTKLIKVLQDDNYKLEEERARLKHQLKQQSLLYTNNTPWDRYKNLTPEQLFRVDQYVLKLQAGEAEDPSDFYKLKKENTVLKAQMEALNSKGFEFAKTTIEGFLKELGIGGDSGKLFDKLQNGNEELKRMIRELMSQAMMAGNSNSGAGMMQPTSSEASVMHYTGVGRFRPPQPSMGHDGEVATGYSYKFQANLEVADKDGKSGLGENQTRYDVAFLQLQLQECFELNKRKDEELATKNLEIESLYKRIRDYLLVQDQLYKDYVRNDRDTHKVKEEFTVKIRNVTDSFHEEQRKVEKLQELVQQLQNGVNPQSLQARLIELTKQNSLLDVNLLRLTRKYQTLSEQEDLLRREYHSREADSGEKDTFVQQRINSLKEWKARAIQQLKYLFTKLRLAVPQTEFQAIQGENEVLKQRNADYIERNSKFAEKVSKLQTQVRENLESEEKLRLIQESKDDLENEYEVTRKRLEQVDPQFKWENAVFNKVIAVLKRHKVSPQQAFEEFDRNKDGRLTREEFIRALELLKIGDLSQQEIDLLVNSCDYDADGFISYKEFVRKLSRHGVKSRTPEEQILYLLIESLRRGGIKSLSDAFELFDKERRGSLSRDDFKDVFSNMKLRIDEQEVERFIEHFWRDQKAGIDYEAFLRIFQRYQLNLQDEEKKRGVAVRIPDDVLRLKKRVFTEVNSALSKAGKRLESLFGAADINQDSVIDKVEFAGLFDKMRIKLTDSELSNIFMSIDFDLSGQISYPEFISDFNKTIQTNIPTLLQQEKERFESEMHRSSYGRSAQEDQVIRNDVIVGGAGIARQNQELNLQTKIAILETREKQLNRKLQTAMTIMNHSSQSQIEVQKQYDMLEKRWSEMTEQFHIDKQHIIELDEQLRQSIKKEDARKLQEMNERLQTDLTETKAAMLSYKNMNETVGDQVKGLKLILERRKDENENLVTAVRELSSQSDEQKRLGKLYYLVMLSRWQEAALSRKYDGLLNENREMRKELINTDQLLQNKEHDHHRAENMLQEQILFAEKLRKQIADSKNIFLSLDKAEEFNARITEIYEDKTVLEERHFSMMSKFRSTQLTMDEALAKAENAQDLLDVLQRSKQSDLSDRMIALSDRIQSMKLGEMRATRELTEVKEKNNYLSRLLRTQNEQVKKLEEKVAEFESKLNKREEEFRRADNERMRRFFNARYDDIPGALNNPGRETANENFFGGASSSMRRSGGDNLPKRSQTSVRAETAAIGRETNVDHSSRGMTNAFNASAGSGGDSKFLEGKLRKLEQELQKAMEDIRVKDSIISRFKDWQLADKYLSEDEVLREQVESQHSRVKAVHDQESKEMAEAAAQMVRTLQEMLDQKNEQLRGKEDQISRLREQMVHQSEQDGIEIGRLRSQMSLAAGTTLAKLQEIVVKNEHGYHQSMPMGGAGQRYEKLTREELSRALDEKDTIIAKCKSEISGQEKQLLHLKEKNANLHDEVFDLQSSLDIERQQTELKTKIRELEKVRRELHEKDSHCQKLRTAVDRLNERMQQYEIEKSGVSEDKKMNQISEELKRKEQDSEVSKVKSKLVMIEQSKKQLTEDLKNAKIKEQELLEANKKLASENVEHAKTMKVKDDRLAAEIRQREKLQIDLNQVMRSMSSLKNGAAGSLTYEQLLVKVKELENDNIILKCQNKPVVIFNKELGTFEYIGQPIPLAEGDQQDQGIEDFIANLQKWLNRSENQSLTVRSIFESLDRENFGELTESKFETAMHKIGVDLRPKERRLLKDTLDPKNIGFLKYRSLLRELQGIPQTDFIPHEVQRIANFVVDARDLDPVHFKKLIDPTNIEMMTLQQLQESIAQVRNEQFQMGSEEVEHLFKSVAKCQRTIGVTLSITKLTDKVFKALDALLIERMRDSVAKSVKPLSEVFGKHDSNKDGSLEYKELENMFLDLQLAFKNQAFFRVTQQILDPAKKAGKIHFNTLKFYLMSDNSVSHQSQSISGSATNTLGSSKQPKHANFDMEPSQDRDVSEEELVLCKSGARKILQSFQANIVEAVQGCDRFDEGIVSREDLQKTISDHRVPELTPAELQILLKASDRGSKGYISTDKFIERLKELVSESKGEAALRLFAMNCKRQSINLRQELMKYDSTRNGRLDKKTFMKAMSQLPVTVADDAVDLLFQAGESQDYNQSLDIKTFIDKVVAASKYNPLQVSALLQMQKPTQATKGKTVTTASAQNGGANFESWEVEKKYKTKLAALQQQIEESKKETQAGEKQARHWQEMANRFEREKNSLQARLVDYNAKPPRAQTIESNSQAQLEQVHQLKEQVFYLQQANQKLEGDVKVELTSQIRKQLNDNDRLVEKNRQLAEEVKRLEQQIGRIFGKSDQMDPIEKREEGELWRERKIQDLEKELSAREQSENDINDQLFKADEKLLDLRFQKETFDLQYARLQKRITDLEQYKLASSKYSSVLLKNEEREKADVDSKAGLSASTLLGVGPSLKKDDQGEIKLRSKSSKSMAELEMLVESLKRVIEKQKAESDALKKQVVDLEQRQEKLKSEKQLRQRIETLEAELHSYEMKDVNVGEKDRTIRKLIQANRQLNEDLEKELERFTLMENRYKELLVKFNVSAKENAKFSEMMFAQSTGGKLANFQSYLGHQEGKQTEDDFIKRFERGDQ